MTYIFAVIYETEVKQVLALKFYYDSEEELFKVFHNNVHYLSLRDSCYDEIWRDSTGMNSQLSTDLGAMIDAWFKKHENSLRNILPASE